MHERIVAHRTALVAVVVLASAGTVVAAEGSRLAAADELLAGNVTWVAADGDLVAFGADRRLVLASASPGLAVVRELSLPAPVIDAILVRTDLYVNDGAEVLLVDLETSPLRRQRVHLQGEPRGRLRLARLIDHLVVAEDGAGLRFIELRIPPNAPQPGHHGHGPHDSREVAFLALQKNFHAVATFENLVYAATDDGAIHVIDVAGLSAGSVAGDERSGILRTWRLDDVRALAAKRESLYVLGSTGLRILDLTDGTGTRLVTHDPQINGEALDSSGRRLLVAAGPLGLRMFHDASEVLATVDVSVGNNFFSPSVVSIDVGDRVRWNKTTGFHNVESCDGTQVGCGGSAAAESFRSGNATNNPFTFSHTFTGSGTNPYICIVHGGFGMTGSVNVAGGGTCDDDVACTDDTGVPGNCFNTPNDALCDNGNVCDGAETCDPVADCQSGTPLNCNDGVACTEDSCSSGSGCVNPPNDALCDNGNVCDGAEMCDPVADCQSGTPLNCNDGVACTEDSCSSGSGCVNAPNDAACDDGDPCSGVEACSGGGCQSGVPLDDGSSCADGDVCDGVETCSGGSCGPGEALPDGDADGVCDALDVCPAVPDPGQANDDGDIRGDACDCLPRDAAVWAVPGGTSDLTLFQTGDLVPTTAMNWTAPAMPGGTAVVYDVVRSAVPGDFVTSAECVETDGADTGSTDASTPPPGVVHFFVVRAETACGGGPIGANSSGVARVARGCP